MIKILVTDIIPDPPTFKRYNLEHLRIALELKDENTVILTDEILLQVIDNIGALADKTLIEPGLASRNINHQTKRNKLFSYICANQRRLNINIVILTGAYEALDKRIKAIWDVIERYREC